MFGIQGWVDPVDDGRISGGTGKRKAFRTKNGNLSSSYHHGIDIAKGMNAPIKAAFGGKVVQAGWINGYGKVVVVRAPDGTYAQYSHLNDFNVSVGQTLTAGEQLGRMGQTGNSTGPHLDLIISRNGYSLDENGKPHTRAKPWLRDGGGTAASYKPADPNNRALATTSSMASDVAQAVAAAQSTGTSGLTALAQQLSALAQSASGTSQTEELTAPTMPDDEKIDEVNLLGDISKLNDDRYSTNTPAAEQPSYSGSLPQDLQTEVSVADNAHENWISSLKQSIETANYSDAQKEALQKMFESSREPAPVYDTIPDGISSYIDSLIKKV